MKKITLISYHSWNSKRKAGFHWLAEGYESQGYQILFITAPISFLSVLYQDHRCKTITKKNCLTQISETIYLFPYFTLLHPENYKKISIFNAHKVISGILSVIDTLLLPIFNRYGKEIPKQLKKAIVDSDYFIFECTPGIMLFKTIKNINPRAKTIYRVSDDMKFLNHHPIVLDYEKKVLKDFDLISVPTQYMFQKISHLDNVKIHHHGISKEIFERNYPIPVQYHRFEKNFVFVGCAYLDFHFLKTASELFPKFGFHIIGPLRPEILAENVLFYGECDFAKTVPFIKYGDVGLQTLFTESSVQIFSISLKILQYTWCKLPILVPWEIGRTYSHFIPYKSDEKSIKVAIEEAIFYDRSTIDRSWIHSWDEIAIEMLKDVEHV